MPPNQRSKSKPIGTDIRIIGSRNAGKTTYLAALLRFPKELKRQFPGLTITSITEEGEKLIEAAKNIIERGGKFAPTDKGEEPSYNFQISIPRMGSSAGVELELHAKDYAGELFEWLGQPQKQFVVQPYLDDWCSATGWMIMLTDWQLEKDARLYAPALDRLLEELNNRATNKSELYNTRIAVVMTKCERGELWSCRLDAEEDLFRVRLPETYRILKARWSSQRCQFFACSAFGVLSDRPGDRDPRPNRYIPDDGSSAESSAYLRDRDAWKPYGLISPLYWLSTGRVFHDERL